MPSPIAHASLGYVIFRVATDQNRKNAPAKSRRLFFVFTVAFSLMPDLDAVLGVLLGDIGRQHNGISHSLGLGFIVGIITGAVARVTRGASFRRWFLLAYISYSMHLLLDYWSTRRGIKLYWPLSNKRFSSPFKLFYGVRWKLPPWNIKHLWTLITELVFVSVVITLTCLFLRKKELNADRHHAAIFR